jgi:hypothetical protein
MAYVGILAMHEYYYMYIKKLNLLLALFLLSPLFLYRLTTTVGATQSKIFKFHILTH